MDASFRLDPDQFRQWLRAKNLSRRRISDATGISRSLFRRWETGTTAISRRTAERLTSEVGVPRELLEAIG